MKSNSLISIRKKLLDWYGAAKRSLPWRETTDPYRIWVSEVMLQQTQVVTVVPYYESFLEVFPRVERLAAAELGRVLKVWEGLGYYARARNLHRAAGMVCETHDGSIPNDLKAFRALPGVGDYICAAVLSIAFGAPLAAVDGNVKRVLSRLFLIDAPVNRSSGAGAYSEAAEKLLDRARPGTFNQATMELGALVCRPARPACGQCPLARHCGAFRSGAQAEFPRRAKKAAPPEYRVVVGVVEHDGRVLITQRAAEGLLGGLWEFPGGKVRTGETARGACERELREEVGLSVEVTDHIARVKHAYTHFKVDMDVFRCRYRGGEVVLDGPADYRWVAVDDLAKFPIPKANKKFLQFLKKSPGED